ncbi:Urocanate hydratase, partial [Araneus ventricosus]
LRRQVSAINYLADKGLFFWDYGNAFLLEANRAGADVGARQEGGRVVFRYPSYVQHIMGDIFSLGFGPFRWVCTSNSQEDLQRTDHMAASVLEDILEEGVPPLVEDQYKDNVKWIKEAASHKLQHEGYFGTDLVTLNRFQMTRKTPELAAPLQTSTPHRREEIWLRRI